MPQMPAAIGAVDLRAHHEKCPVNLRADGAFKRGVKGRPARAAFIFCGGVEQGLAASGA